MSYGYYAEEGSSKIDNQNVRQAAALIRLANPSGALHIVVDDWNLDDIHLTSCMDDEDATSTERQLMRMMLALTPAERASAMGLAEGYWFTTAD